MKSESGFTLVELMGVVALVGILTVTLSAMVANGFKYSRVVSKRSKMLRDAMQVFDQLVHGEKKDAGLIAAVDYNVFPGAGECDELLFQTAEGTTVKYYVVDDQLFRQRAEGSPEQLMTNVRKFRLESVGDGLRISFGFELPALGLTVEKELETFVRLRNLVTPSIEASSN